MKGYISLDKMTNHHEGYLSLDKMSNHHVNLYNKVVNILNLENPDIDPALGIIISVIKPGGYVHSHRDLYSSFPNTKHLTNKRNVRFNVMVDRGEDNCYNPKIEDKFYEVNRCDGWCFAASVYRHRTELVSGPEYRVVYQFGFCMDAI